MKGKWIAGLAVCWFANPLALASEPVWIGWSKIHLEEQGGLFISAEKEPMTGVLKHFHIGTPDGVVELDDEILQRVERPRLNYIETIVFPLDIGGDAVEYRVAVRYGGNRFDDEEICVIEDDGEEIRYAPERLVVFIVRDGSLADTRWTMDSCD